VSPVRYELGFYILEDILHSDRRENLKFYKAAASRSIRSAVTETVCSANIVLEVGETSCNIHFPKVECIRVNKIASSSVGIRNIVIRSKV
jgi:hypothetical protein